MKTYAFGWDFGNGESKAVVVIKGIQHRITVPTAFYRINTTAMQSLTPHDDEGAEMSTSKEGGKSTKRAGKGGTKTKAFVPPPVVGDADPNKPSVLEPNEIIIRMEKESIHYAYGLYALRQTENTWNGNDDIQRYASKYALKGLLATAALLVPDAEFGLLVVTGVPASIYIKYPQLRKEIKEALDGKHSFTLDQGKTWRTITVEVATVVMEGAGALLAYPGITKNTEAAVIDIGYGTTDLYGQVGAQPIIEYCQGTNVAVLNAARLLKRTFAEKKKRELTDNETRIIMHAFVTGRKSALPDTINSYGDPVTVDELWDMVVEAIDTIGDDIAGFVVRTWKEGIARFKPIVLIGGGTLYFYTAIKKRVEHGALHDDPVFANPRGYATLAARKLLARSQQAIVTASASTNAVQEPQESQEVIGG